MSDRITLKLAESNRFGRAGEIVTLALTPSDVHDPTELPSYLAGYRPPDYRAPDAAPVVPVDFDEGYYRSFDSDDAFRRVNVKGSLQGAVNEVDPKSALVSYKCVPRFIGSFIPVRTTANEGGGLLRARQAATRRCVNALALDLEIDLWTLLVTTGTWSSASFYTTLVAGQQWNGGASSDPIANLQSRMVASLQPVTDIWMNEQAWFSFFGNPKVKDHMRQWFGDRDNAALDARDIRLPALGGAVLHMVPSKVRSEASTAVGYTLGNHCVLTCAPPGVPVDGETISTVKTFRVKGLAGVGYETREYHVDGRGAEGGTMVVVYTYDVLKVTGSNCGGLIVDVHQ